MAISNYTKSLVKENTEKGIPVQRPLFMEFPGDATSWQITYQYMFGPDVLVAPVIATNITVQKVYLPPGDWKFLWDNVTYHGPGYGQFLAPLGKPPVFYKPSSTDAAMFDQIKTDFPLVPPPGPPPRSRPISHRPSTVKPYSCPTFVPVGSASLLTGTRFISLLTALCLWLSLWISL